MSFPDHQPNQVHRRTRCVAVPTLLTLAAHAFGCGPPPLCKRSGDNTVVIDNRDGTIDGDVVVDQRRSVSQACEARPLRPYGQAMNAMGQIGVIPVGYARGIGHGDDRDEARTAAMQGCYEQVERLYMQADARPLDNSFICTVTACDQCTL
jgi:hypothetical protein